MTKSIIRIGQTALAFLLIVSGTLFAAEVDWPEYLGPDGRGHGVEVPGKSAPTSWSEKENIVWKTEIPGRGWSSPVIDGNEIWFTNADEKGNVRSLLCFDRTNGKKLKDIVLFNVEKPEYCHRTNSYASSTPVLEKGRIYVHFGAVGTACLDTKTGEKIWERTDLQWKPIQGFGASPTIYKNLLILTCDGGDVQFLIALDKTTGKTVWQTKRSADFTGVKPVFQKGYCSSIVRTVGGTEYLLSSSSKAAYAYDPATGKELWRFDFPKFAETSTMRPQVWKDNIIVNSGFGEPATLYSFPIKQTGVVNEKIVLWQNGKNIARCPVPVTVGDYLYGCDGAGIIWCISLADGKTTWRKRIGADQWASPIYQNGLVYFFDATDKSIVVKADPTKCEVVSVNTLDSGCMATPVFLGDTIILRSKTHLYCIRK